MFDFDEMLPATNGVVPVNPTHSASNSTVSLLKFDSTKSPSGFMSESNYNTIVAATHLLAARDDSANTYYFDLRDTSLPPTLFPVPTADPAVNNSGDLSVDDLYLPSSCSCSYCTTTRSVILPAANCCSAFPYCTCPLFIHAGTITPVRLLGVEQQYIFVASTILPNFGPYVRDYFIVRDMRAPGGTCLVRDRIIASRSGVRSAVAQSLRYLRPLRIYPTFHTFADAELAFRARNPTPREPDSPVDAMLLEDADRPLFPSQIPPPDLRTFTSSPLSPSSRGPTLRSRSGSTSSHSSSSTPNPPTTSVVTPTPRTVQVLIDILSDKSLTKTKVRAFKAPVPPPTSQERFTQVCSVVDAMAASNHKEAFRLIKHHKISDAELSHATLDELKIRRAAKLTPLARPKMLRRPVPPPQPNRTVKDPTYLDVLDDLPSFAYLAAEAVTYGRTHSDIGYSQQEFTKALKLARKFINRDLTQQGLIDDMKTAWSDFKELTDAIRAIREFGSNVSNKFTEYRSTIYSILSTITSIADFSIDLATIYKLSAIDSTFAATFAGVKLATWTSRTLTSVLPNSRHLIAWVLKLIQPNPIIMQGNDDEHVFLAIFKQLFHMFTGHGDPAINLARSKRIHSLFGSINSVASFVKNLAPLLREILALLLSKLTGVEMRDLRKEALTLLREMNTLLASDATSSAHIEKITIALAKADELEEYMLFEVQAPVNEDVNLTDDIIQSLKDVVNKVPPPSFRSIVPTFTRRVERLRLRLSALQSLLDANQTKVESLNFYWVSTPGLGKNSHLDCLTRRVHTLLGDEIVDNNPVYQMPIDSEYHDNLRPDAHTTVFLDEFLNTEDPQKLSLHSDLSLAMTAGTAVRANHSVAERKAVHAFKHDMFFLLTNHLVPPNSFLKLPIKAAFTRRYRRLRTTCSHPSYNAKTGVWNPVVLTDPEETYSNYYTYYVADFIDSPTGIKVSTEVAYTYAEFTRYCRDRIQEKRLLFQSRKRNIENPLPPRFFAEASFNPRNLINQPFSDSSVNAIRILLQTNATKAEFDYVINVIIDWCSKYTEIFPRPPDFASSSTSLVVKPADMSEMFEPVVKFATVIHQLIIDHPELAPVTDSIRRLSTAAKHAFADTGHYKRILEVFSPFDLTNQGIFDYVALAGNTTLAVMQGALSFYNYWNYGATDFARHLLGSTRAYPLSGSFQTQLVQIQSLLPCPLLIDHRYYSFDVSDFEELNQSGFSYLPSLLVHERGLSIRLETELFTEFGLGLDAFLSPGSKAVDQLETLRREDIEFLRQWCLYKSPFSLEYINLTTQPDRYKALLKSWTKRAVEEVLIKNDHYFKFPLVNKAPDMIISHIDNRSVMTAAYDSFQSLSILANPLLSGVIGATISFLTTMLVTYATKWFINKIIDFFVPPPIKVEIVLEPQNKKYESGQPSREPRQPYSVPMPTLVNQGGFTKFLSKGLEEMVAVVLGNEFEARIHFSDPESGMIYTSSKFLIRFYAGTTFGTNYHSLHYSLTHDLQYSTLEISKGTWTSRPIPLSKCKKISRFAMAGDSFVQDYVFVNVPPVYMNPARNISSYFAKQAQINDDYRYHVSMIVPDYSKQVPTIYIRPLETGNFAKQIHTRADLRDGTPLTLEVVDSMWFPGLTHAGECNSLYVVDNPKITRPLFGSHDAADTVNGHQYALLLFEELILAGIQSAEPSRLPITHPLTNESITSKWIVTGKEPEIEFLPDTCIPITMLDKPFNHHINHKNNLIRTPMFPGVAHTKKPASQSVQALRNITKKLNSPDFVVANPMYPIAALKYGRRLLQMTPVTPMTLSVEQVLNGPIGSHKSHPMRILTSPGFLKPLCVGKPGKSALIELIGESKVITPLMRTILDNYNKQVDEGVPNYITQLNMKVELRTNDRVDAEATRGFWANRVDNHIVSTQEFGAFFSAMQAHPDLCRCVIGVEPGSASWGKLIGKIRENGHNLVQADISSNDIRAHRKSLFTVFKLIEDWYDKYDDRPSDVKLYHKKRRYHLMLASIGRLVQVGSLLYQHDHGIDSGRDWTSYVVSILRHIDYMAIKMRLLYNHYPSEANSILNDDEKLYATFPSFHYGDDAIGSIPPAFPLINNNTIHKVAEEEHGLDLTDPWKSGETTPDYYPWSLADFLSRGAVKRDGYWWAPLREDTIFNIPFYRIDDDVPNPVKCLELVNAALVEYFQYGEARFRQEQVRLNNELARLRYPLSTLTYEKVYADWHANY